MISETAVDVAYAFINLHLTGHDSTGSEEKPR
jgi:hypothetical protein